MNKDSHPVISIDSRRPKRPAPVPVTIDREMVLAVIATHVFAIEALAQVCVDATDGQQSKEEILKAAYAMGAKQLKECTPDELKAALKRAIGE